ncbi:MAG: transcriptional regulator [Deltaproteobacteria bacterium]|nr:MAG: transcriptional regulator [Deltaproteobacteria bacterium]
MKLPFAWEHLIGVIALLLFCYGQVFGLFMVPPDAHMGDVARILFVHVPSAWNAFFVFTIAFVCALGYLISGRKGFDHALEAALEVGILLTILLLMTGSIFAKPTWDVWWKWEPRLTSSAIMLMTYVGVVVLRSVVQDNERRAVWSSAATILASVTLPLTYFSVQIWRSIHQIQTSPADIDAPLRMAWRINALAVLLLATWFLARRWRIAARRWELGDAPPLPEPLQPEEV